MNFRVSEAEAIQQYRTKVKLFSNGTIKTVTYDKLISRKKNGFEEIKNDSSNFIVSEDSQVVPVLKKKHELLGELRKDNLVRSRNLLIDFVCENEKLWQSFITLTFAENLTDLTKANRLFNIWCSHIRRSFSDFSYVCVPEFQKRGAVHYHLLTNLPMDSDYIFKQAGSDSCYDVLYWNHGFSSAFDILNKVDQNFNIALYITKYLYKDIDNRLYGRRRVMTSSNLKKPSVLYLEKSDTWQNALEYLNKKAYNIQTQTFPGDGQYIIGGVVDTIKCVSDLDFTHVDSILQDKSYKLD